MIDWHVLANGFCVSVCVCVCITSACKLSTFSILFFPVCHCEIVSNAGAAHNRFMLIHLAENRSVWIVNRSICHRCYVAASKCGMWIVNSAEHTAKPISNLIILIEFRFWCLLLLYSSHWNIDKLPTIKMYLRNCTCYFRCRNTQHFVHEGESNKKRKETCIGNLMNPLQNKITHRPEGIWRSVEKIQKLSSFTVKMWFL